VPKPQASPYRVRSVERLHARLRKLIVDGKYPPGAVLSQVQLAQMLGVSRTPLREAIRRLEAEGLVEAEQNQRARVAALEGEALDILFTERILLEATAIKVSLPLLAEVDLNAILAAATAFRVATERDNGGAADRARRLFHRSLVCRAGKTLREQLASRFDRCENYRRMHVMLPSDTNETYTNVAAACIGRNTDAATRLIARLEGGLAREVLARVDAQYEPTAIGVALQMLRA
jgi:DNA-binding GntR family transcriptional regulator